MADRDAPDVVVVGGGVAGLVLARDLARAGLRVTVLEAAEQLGGSVLAHEVQLAGDSGTLRLDAGAESFATRSPAVTELLADLGLAADVVQPAATGAWVHGPAGSVPLPRTGMLGIPGSVWAEDVRRVVGVRGAVRGTLDRVLPARVGLGRRSIGELVRVRLGRRVLDRLVAPVVSGVHSAHPDDVDLDTVLPGLRARLAQDPYRPFGGGLSAAVAAMRAAAPAGSAVAGVRGGMHRMVDALTADAERFGADLRTGAAVTALEEGQGVWQVHHAGGEVSARALVATTPDAVRLLRASVPGIQGLAAPQGSGVQIVTLVVDSPALDAAPRGTGVLVAQGAATVRAKALTHATAKWAWLADQAGPGRHVLRLSYGRRPHDGAAGGADAAIQGLGTAGLPPVGVDVALADASVLLGVPLHRGLLVGQAQMSWPAGVPHTRPGHGERVRAVREALGAERCLWASGAWLAGAGLAAVVTDARATAASVRTALAQPPVRG